MATTKAGQKAVNKYMKKNYDRLLFTIPKGKKEIIKGFADAQDESVNTYKKKAVSARIKKETGEDISL